MSDGFAFARAASHPIVSGVRDFGTAGKPSDRSDRNAGYHFTLAFGPVPAPGWRRLSSMLFVSPGTGSPLAVVVPVEAQLLSPQMAAVRMANIKRYFIASRSPCPFRRHKCQSWRNPPVRESRPSAKQISRDISLSGNLSKGFTFLHKNCRLSADCRG